MVALLLDYVDLGHQAAEVLSVIRQMVKIGGVEEVRARRHTGAIEDYIQRFTAAQGDGVGGDVKVVSRLITQQFGVVPNHLHRNTKRSQGLVFGNVQIGNSQ